MSSGVNVGVIDVDMLSGVRVDVGVSANVDMLSSGITVDVNMSSGVNVGVTMTVSGGQTLPLL